MNDSGKSKTMFRITFFDLKEGIKRKYLNENITYNEKRGLIEIKNLMEAEDFNESIGIPRRRIKFKLVPVR